MYARTCLWAGMFSLVATAAMANTEIINPITIVPNQPVDLFFPNPHPPHPDHKDLRFVGTANVIPGAIGILEIDFDYLDPNTGGFTLIPLPPITIPGGAPFPIDTGIVTLPFCPQEVSLHLTNLTISAAPIPIVVQGVFTHICYPTPEPSTWVLASTAAVGLLAVVRRRRRAAGSPV